MTQSMRVDRLYMNQASLYQFRTFSTESKQPAPEDDGSEHIKEMKTMEDWNAILDSKTPVIFQCSASWCRPCQVLRPKLEKIIKQHGGKVIFYYVDIEKHPDVADMLQVIFHFLLYIFKVAHVPQVFSVKNGELVDSFSGVVEDDVIENFIKAVTD
eukprot:403374859